MYNFSFMTLKTIILPLQGQFEQIDVVLINTHIITFYQ